jgi:hypothetical protein
MDLRRAPFSVRLFKEPRIDVTPYVPWGYVDSTRRWLFMPPPHFFLFLIDARSLVCVQLYIVYRCYFSMVYGCSLWVFIYTPVHILCTYILLYTSTVMYRCYFILTLLLTLRILNSQFSILNSQFSILNSQFSILNSQFSILNSQFSIHEICSGYIIFQI